MAAKILTLDIETAPMVVVSFGLFNQNIGINQIHEPGRVIAFGGKWMGSKKVIFRSEFHDGHEKMMKDIHALIDEADIVIHYNGTTFDMPWLNTEFWKLGLLPPSPVQQLDLLKTARKVFRLDSNKLQFFSQAAGLTGKLDHTGMQMWMDIMFGDAKAKAKAWKIMKEYNIQDVVTTEELYHEILPWIPNHPHLGAFTSDGMDHCPNCSSTLLQKRGFRFTLQGGAYQQYQCQNCGKWCKNSRSVSLQKTRGTE